MATNLKVWWSFSCSRVKRNFNSVAVQRVFCDSRLAVRLFSRIASRQSDFQGNSVIASFGLQIVKSGFCEIREKIQSSVPEISVDATGLM
jgi:hypothetical protein